MGGLGSGHYRLPDATRDAKVAGISKQILDRCIPKAYLLLEEKIEKGRSLEAAIYAIDRREGRPKAIIDGRMTHGIDKEMARVLLEQARAAQLMVQEDQTRLLGEYIEGQVVSESTPAITSDPAIVKLDESSTPE